MTPTHEQLWEWLTPAGMLRLCGKIEVLQGDLDCWVWTGASTNGYGYIYITMDGKQYSVPVHRLMMVLCYGGEWPEELPKARHYVCGNSLCCNPRHMLPGTTGDNNGDIAEDGTGKKEERQRRRRQRYERGLAWVRDRASAPTKG